MGLFPLLETEALRRWGQKHLEDGAHVTCLGLGKSDLFSYLFGKA